jgi:acetyl coenzyme A synthetase (ADP forming)-like protein
VVEEDRSRPAALRDVSHRPTVRVEGPLRGHYDRRVTTYPHHREADVVLRDGSTVHLRPVRPGDEQALLELFEGLGDSSTNFRFFSGGTDLGAAAARMADVDFVERYGLVATRGDGGRSVGHATYLADSPGRAEVAFAIADEMQGLGLGTILLAHLAEVAEENGIQLFFAEVLPENHRMIEVFRDSGFAIETFSEPGTIRVELPTSFNSEAVRRFEERDRLAAAAAVRRFLEPRAVAVIGASRRRGTVGGEVFHNMLGSGFAGSVFPVNPATHSVQAVRAYRSVSEIPGPVDLAVVAVPAAAAIEAARECASAGVAALVVLSAGFAESGEEGAERQRELVALCRETGMRLIGPNCLGILANGEASPLNATFAPGSPPPGNVGFVTQSGALGLALIDLAEARGLGVSSFASIGNRADITGNDLLEYWEEDRETRVAMLYIESFSDPGRFSRVARRAGRSMPILAVKSGRSVAGERATGSHTGALLSASDVTVDALFEQAGVIRTETLSELLDVASLLAGGPLPAGNRVGILTNAGGPGIMCADACEAAGLEVPEIPPPIRERLAEHLPAEAALANPVDMIATAGAEQFRHSIASLARWDGIDSLIVIFIRPLLTPAEDVAAAVAEAAGDLPRPIPLLAVFMSTEDREAMAGSGAAPTYMQPEDAARALGRVMRHVGWRDRPRAVPHEFADVRGDEAAAILAEALGRRDEWLGADEVLRLLGCYGIPVPGGRIAADPAAAGRAAGELAVPVALKAWGPDIRHKTELGAVRVGLSGEAEVEREAAQMGERLAAVGAEHDGFLLQEMVEDGVELLIGIVNDPAFGPVLACGAGGTAVELLGDVAVRICPLLADDPAEMLGSLAIHPLLTGFRGEPGVDVGALEEMLLRVSQMVDSHREVVELDLNPVIARPDGVRAVDARVRIRPAAPARPWPSTWRPLGG